MNEKVVIIDENAIQKEAIKVTLLANKRYVEDNISELVFQKGIETEICPKDLKSKIIQKMIMDGVLKIVEGSINFKFKDACVFAKAGEDVIYYKIKNSTYQKDLLTGQEVLLYSDDKKDISRNEKIKETA